MPFCTISSSSRRPCVHPILHTLGLLTPKCGFLICKHYTVLAYFMHYRLAFLHNRHLFLHNHPSSSPTTTTLGGGKCRKAQYIVVKCDRTSIYAAHSSLAKQHSWWLENRQSEDY